MLGGLDYNNPEKEPPMLKYYNSIGIIKQYRELDYKGLAKKPLILEELDYNSSEKEPSISTYQKSI